MHVDNALPPSSDALTTLPHPRTRNLVLPHTSKRLGHRYYRRPSLKSAPPLSPTLRYNAPQQRRHHPQHRFRRHAIHSKSTPASSTATATDSPVNGRESTGTFYAPLVLDKYLGAQGDMQEGLGEGKREKKEEDDYTEQVRPSSSVWKGGTASDMFLWLKKRS